MRIFEKRFSNKKNRKDQDYTVFYETHTSDTILKERLKDNDIELAVFDIQDASSYNDSEQQLFDDSQSNQDTNSVFTLDEEASEDVSL